MMNNLEKIITDQLLDMGTEVESYIIKLFHKHPEFFHKLQTEYRLAEKTTDLDGQIYYEDVHSSTEIAKIWRTNYPEEYHCSINAIEELGIDANMVKYKVVKNEERAEELINTWLNQMGYITFEFTGFKQPGVSYGSCVYYRT